MRKICFVGLENLPVLAREYNHHGIGGEQVQQTLLATAFAKRGYEVSMVTADYGQRDGEVWRGVRVHKAYRSNSGIPIFRFLHPRWTKTWAALKRANADVYYTSCAGMMVGLIAIFCRIYGRGLVFRLASNRDVDPLLTGIRYIRDKKLYLYGLKASNVVLSQHKYQQELLYHHFGVCSNIAEMVVDPPVKNLPLSLRDIPVLWVSNLRNLKRPELMLEVAKQLTHWHHHMIGGPQKGSHDLFDVIVQGAAHIPNLTFHGQIPYHDVGDFYDRSRLFVNTSDVEGFPNSYLQSWRRGVPVVAFFDPDGLIAREGLGFVVASVEEMSKVINRILMDEKEWNLISDRCRRYMELNYGDDLILEPYIKAFDDACRIGGVSD